MRKKLFFLAACVLTVANANAQTTLFADNFDTAGLPNPPVSPSQYQAFSGAPGTTSTVSSAGHTYTGINTSLWKLDSGNGTSGLNAIYNVASTSYTTNLSIQGTSVTTAGQANKATATVAVPVPFSPKLSENTDVLTWSFAMRVNKNGQLTTLPSAFKPAGALAGGVILATDLPAGGNINTAGNGYAVILSGDSGTLNAITLGSFAGGLYDTATSTSHFTPLLQVESIAFSNSSSVIVSYTPSTNTWTMKVRQDGSASLQDPQETTENTYTTSTPASIVDSSQTGIANSNMMLYFNYSGTNGIYMDNLKVTSGAVLATATAKSKNSFSIAPNPAKNYFNIENNGKKINSVLIYSLDGKVVKSLTNPQSKQVDVSVLPKGTYLVKVNSENSESTKKLMVN
ncbi:T9SS type A sorting domain-containing protein [Chryseobacterium gotjawalense]|uniref:T9SS type A sorting domain-containing protein n=1 Tax=Chryseobacterium gotjawalense TaxID=3042315 RepID=A0ABY8REN2_9FLAO|nr:T9SS type A sorting domain-containing protein [Chryseobacterium sp. wdc7]WHF51474.1 T9SS type A sorting domain-containing protein [Chryseobacterium sp. wdc7]